MKKKTKKMTKGEAVFLLIVGLILGTVFTFGIQYWNVPVTRDEARHVTATFSSYKEVVRRKRSYRVREIVFYFNDYEQLCIDGVCIDDELRSAIREIEPGSVLKMIVHPNSGTILELEVDAMQLLEFQTSVEKLSGETSGFIYLGAFCYVLALVGVYSLVFQRKSK